MGSFQHWGFDVKLDTELVATELQHLRLGNTDKDAEVAVYDDLGVTVIDRNAMIPDFNVANTEADVFGSHLKALTNLKSRPLADLLKRISVGRVHAGDMEGITSFGTLTDNRVPGEVTSVGKGRSEMFWRLSFAPGEVIRCIDTTSTNASGETCPPPHHRTVAAMNL